MHACRVDTSQTSYNFNSHQPSCTGSARKLPSGEHEPRDLQHAYLLISIPTKTCGDKNGVE